MKIRILLSEIGEGIFRALACMTVYYFLFGLHCYLTKEEWDRFMAET